MKKDNLKSLKTNKIIVLGLSAILLFSLTACAQTDVVAKTAVSSFSSILDLESDQVVAEESGYALQSPSGLESFHIGENIAISFELAPFVNAGLDTALLPDYIETEGEMLSIKMKNEEYAEENSAKDVFGKLVENNRDAIGYHAALDHYGVALGNGNMFEWAKDILTNDKDIVFVLNPQPFIDAWVDVNKVEGWVFAKVEMMEDGKKVEVDKLLKPFDLQ